MSKTKTKHRNRRIRNQKSRNDLQRNRESAPRASETRKEGSVNPPRCENPRIGVAFPVLLGGSPDEISRAAGACRHDFGRRIYA
jgi:hypothetical protein